MVSLIVTETGKSNKPVEVLGLKSTTRSYLEWIERIAKNPKRYSIEINLKSDCDEMFSERYYQGFNRVLRYMLETTEDLDASVDAGIIGSIFGFLEALTFVQSAKGEIEGIEGESGI